MSELIFELPTWKFPKRSVKIHKGANILSLFFYSNTLCYPWKFVYHSVKTCKAVNSLGKIFDSTTDS